MQSMDRILSATCSGWSCAPGFVVESVVSFGDARLVRAVAWFAFASASFVAMASIYEVGGALLCFVVAASCMPWPGDSCWVGARPGSGGLVGGVPEPRPGFV